MRGVALVVVLTGLAGCDDMAVVGGNPGLFEPFMFNDRGYDATFVTIVPIEDPAMLAEGFVGSRDIRVTRLADLTGTGFTAADEAEAAAVAAEFCNGGTLTFVPDADGVFDGRGAYLFAGSCLEQAS